MRNSSRSNPFKALACLLVVSLLSSGLSGCLIVPEAAPLLGHDWKKRILYDVVRGVQCEIRYAVRDQIERDRKGEWGNRKLSWFESWNALIDLDLQVDDSIGFNPGVSLITPNWVPAHVSMGDFRETLKPVEQGYNFGIGGGLNYSAARQDKVQFAYPFGQFLHEKEPTPTSAEQCYNIGGVTIDSNLKISDWLDDVLEPIKKCAFLGREAANDRPIVPLFTSEVEQTQKCHDMDFSKEYGGDPIVTINHKITFTLTFSANASPNWNLVRISTTNNPLFGASRKDTSELLMTFGPPEKGKGDRPLWVMGKGGKRIAVAQRSTTSSGISPVMLLTHNALQIGSAVRDAFR